MPVFTISYDLIKRKDYPELWAELGRLSAQRYLLSQWAVKMVAGTTATTLRDHLKRFVDGDDRLFIARVDNTDWASWNALIDINKL